MAGNRQLTDTVPSEEQVYPKTKTILPIYSIKNTERRPTLTIQVQCTLILVPAIPRETRLTAKFIVLDTINKPTKIPESCVSIKEYFPKKRNQKIPSSATKKWGEDRKARVPKSTRNLWLERTRINPRSTSVSAFHGAVVRNRVSSPCFAGSVPYKEQKGRREAGFGGRGEGELGFLGTSPPGGCLKRYVNNTPRSSSPYRIDPVRMIRVLGVRLIRTKPGNWVGTVRWPIKPAWVTISICASNSCGSTETFSLC